MSTRILLGVLGIAVVLWGTILTRQDYRRGMSRFWLSGGVNMFTFRRERDPGLFWASLITNIVLIALMLFGAIGVIALAGHS